MFTGGVAFAELLAAALLPLLLLLLLPQGRKTRDRPAGAASCGIMAGECASGGDAALFDGVADLW